MSLVIMIRISPANFIVIATHLMNMTPPPCATVEKKPLRIRNAMKALKVVEPAHPAAVHNLLHFHVSGTSLADKPGWPWMNVRCQGEPKQDWESAKVC
jgi:hypothetical protein